MKALLWRQVPLLRGKRDTKYRVQNRMSGFFMRKPMLLCQRTHSALHSTVHLYWKEKERERRERESGQKGWRKRDGTKSAKRNTKVSWFIRSALVYVAWKERGGEKTEWTGRTRSQVKNARAFLSCQFVSRVHIRVNKEQVTYKYSSAMPRAVVWNGKCRTMYAHQLNQRHREREKKKKTLAITIDQWWPIDLTLLCIPEEEKEFPSKCFLKMPSVKLRQLTLEWVSLGVSALPPPCPCRCRQLGEEYADGEM